MMKNLKIHEYLITNCAYLSFEDHGRTVGEKEFCFKERILFKVVVGVANFLLKKMPLLLVGSLFFCGKYHCV